VSNRAGVFLDAVIYPALTDSLLHDTNDSWIKLSLVELFNLLPGSRIYVTTAATRRTAAAWELGTCGPAAHAAVPLLIQVVKGSDSAPRSAAAIALGRIHSVPEMSIPALMACLKDGDIDDSAAEALGDFGTAAKAAVPALVPLVHSREKELRRAAVLSLYKIDPAAAAQAGITPGVIKRLMMDPEVWGQSGAHQPTTNSLTNGQGRGN
jgi:hypothetical protein